MPEAVKARENPHYHWNYVVVEFLVARCHLDVNILHDVGVQKRGVVVEFPALRVVLRRDRQHHAIALESADGGKRTAVVDAGQLPPPQHNDSTPAQ